MTKKDEAEKILRQLNPENQASLLPFFRLAQAAEDSIKKSMGGDRKGEGGGSGLTASYANTQPEQIT
jgi:hypothetical protein